VPGPPSQGIFLSYRREDTAPYARLLQQLFRERIPGTRVFLDMDSIEPGLDFAEIIREALDSCAMLVALIGRQWAALADEDGRPRLHNPEDYVRFEIQTALQRGVRVIPVLVDGARPLRQQQLPAELSKLARLNALELSVSRYQPDADRLLDLIQQVLAAAQTTSTADPSPPAPDADAVVAPPDVRPDSSAPGQALQKNPEVARENRARTIHVLIDAKRVAESITDDRQKARAFAKIAEVLAATDPRRAARLFADAERITQAITDGYSKAEVLAHVAGALVATDPDRAERTARAITDGLDKVLALVAIAEAQGFA
jgi:hypothetical protein